ncbi:MAG: GAF domain-containing sensor histidine kinase [archaeon]|nr:GAF domain-containing sensor histidine kinase [archaeon]
MGTTLKRIDQILQDVFSVFEITVDSQNRGSLSLSISFPDKSIKPDYFFIEYLKGIISAIPEKWDLPSSNIKIISYPFSIEELFNKMDILYRKVDSKYLISDEIIAKEEQITTEDNNKPKSSLQIITKDLYISDIFIKQKTVLNSSFLILKIKWKSFNYTTIAFYIPCMILGIPVTLYFIMNNSYRIHTILSFFLFYETLILLFININRKKELKKIYKEIEKNLTNELSEQKKTTSKALNNTVDRLKSIENLMEITKHIIHEKDIVDLFDNIRKLSARVLNADRTTVFLHDKEHKELRSGPELSEEKQEFRIPEDKGIVGEVFKLKKIVNVKDAYNNPHFNKSVDRQTGYHTKTILSAPLIDIEENFMGVIQVLNKKDGLFQKIDEQILETLSSYIASALKDSLTISDLQKRGIDPDMIDGLNMITTHILNEYNMLQSSILRIDNPAVLNVTSRMKNITMLLTKLVFLFNDKYTPEIITTSPQEIVESFRNFIAENMGDKSIIYSDQMSIPIKMKLQLDIELLNNAAYEILNNSIECIESNGEITLWIHNFVIVPREVVHKFSIQEIINKYNAYSEENYAGFMNFIKARKPLLESDLKIINDAMNDYIALEFFDNGPPIKNEIKDKIFHPFFSTKKSFGLGLAIAKTAMTRMGGMIEGPIIGDNGKSIRILIPRNILVDTEDST